MAFSIPTFAQIRDRMLSDIDTSMTADGTTKGPTEYALATAVSLAMLLANTAIARAARNNVPSKAEPWIMRLWASFFGVFPTAATRNIGQATFAATTGSTLSAGQTVRLRNGVEFTVDADVTESGSGAVTVDLTAVLYGPAGRCLAGTPIFLGSPVAGITTEGVVATGGISTGQDAESDASVLARLLDRLRDPPKGGTEADYKQWVRATPGASADGVWVFNSTQRPNQGPASVLTLFSVTPHVDNSWDPIPTAPEVATVQAYVEPLTPVDLLVYEARAVVAEDLDPVIDLENDTPENRTAVETALREMLLTYQEPGGTILLSHINEAIAGAIGDDDHELTSPVANVTASDDDSIIVLGTVTFGEIA